MAKRTSAVIRQLPSPLDGFSRAEVAAAQELAPVAEDLAAAGDYDAPTALRWLRMVASQTPRD